MKSAVTTGLHNILFNSAITNQICVKLNDLVNRFQSDKQATFIIIVLLFINIIFIVLQCSVQISNYFNLFENLILRLNLNSWRLRIDRDGSIPEWFNYLQTTTCIALLLGVFRSTRQPVYIAWSLIFLFVVMDDSLRIHERVATYAIRTFGLPALPGLRPQDSGELLVWAVIGSVLLGILWWGFARSGSGARAAGGVLALAFAALVFFGIGIDMVHVAFSRTSAVVSVLLAVLEDGGEMLSIGLACALALLLYRHPAIAG